MHMARQLELFVPSGYSEEAGLIEAFAHLLQKPPQKTGQHWLAFSHRLKTGPLYLGIVRPAILGRSPS